MSWYTDGEPFDEYDMSFCKGCTISESKAQCDACIKAHLGEDEEDEDVGPRRNHKGGFIRHRDEEGDEDGTN